MIKPPFLKTGDTIGITAPSKGVDDPLDIVRFRNAESVLKERGYGITFTPNVFTNFEDRSSPAKQRADELESLIEDRNVRYIVSAKGGDFLNEIFEFTDLSKIRDDPKWIQGYSDNTDILMTVTTAYDIMSVYCGNFGDYGMEPWHRSVSENIEFIEGKRKEQKSFDLYETGFGERITGLEPICGTADVVWDSDDCEFEGILLGGCFDKLLLIPGTDRDHVSEFIERHGKPIVWYMEVYASNPNEIRRSIKTMEESGWFCNVSGFIFGRPLFYEGEQDYTELMNDILSGYDVPKVFDADIGHKAPRMTMINGAYAKITIKSNKGTVEYIDL